MSNNTLLCLDTNLFIYYFQADTDFGLKAKKIFALLHDHRARAITSVITQIELMSLKLPEQEIEMYRHHFLQVPRLEIIPVTSEIADEAARIRRTYHFHTPDAIQLATAIVEGADMFITNDARLKKIKEITVKLL